ncbi:MAG: hypothetical protein L0Y79_11645 [Chlorobi bacterium]|nr:hypothetical protein [Chlorobiota bacterium]MCI0716260.1 hypothetical protein [Chlorobiota bacterium]
MRRNLFLTIIAITVAVLIIFPLSLKSQDFNLKLKKTNTALPYQSRLNVNPYIKKTDTPPFIIALYVLTVINPMVVFEDKKVFFALTKEISFGKYPFGRIAFEYSYVFREYNKSHLRLSYNYDIILESGDLAAFVATPGAGFFSDTKNKGWFIHGSAGIFLAPIDYFALYPYLRYRYTYIVDKNKTDIHDVSLGMSFMIYF